NENKEVGTTESGAQNENKEVGTTESGVQNEKEELTNYNKVIPKGASATGVIDSADIENTSNEIDKTKDSVLGTTRSKRSVEEVSPKLVRSAENSNINNSKDLSSLINPKFKFGPSKWDPSDDGTDPKTETEAGKKRYLNVDFTIPKGVKAGDYFKIKLPNEVLPVLSDSENGLNLGKGAPYAKAIYNKTDNLYTITFTNEAQKYQNYRYNFQSRLQINRKLVKKSKEYKMEYIVGDKKSIDNVNVSYTISPNKQVKLVGALVNVEKSGDKYKYNTIYTINKKKDNLKDLTVAVYRHAGFKKDEEKTSIISPDNVTSKINLNNIKVLEVTNLDSLNDSHVLDGVQYKDVTNSFKPKYDEKKDRYTFDFKNTDKTYIISIEGENDKPFTEGKRIEGRAHAFSKSYENSQYYDFIYTKKAPTKNERDGVKINPPEIEKIPNQDKVEVGAPIKEIAVKGMPESKGPLTHEVTGLPDGVTFDKNTNMIKGTPTKSGSYPVTVTTTDKDGNKTETKFNISVTDTTPPKVEKIPNQDKVEVGTPIKDIVVKGTDNGGGPLT
ncbi:Ig-like domain-containing protein, partial [Staphylococcus agnetis]|uniref:Ig-like domain-containing protein n=1 Tax=Staphylococcus agnetis TaxID=985762 RepID=UPI00208E5C25